jgi:hypothetical protein
MLQYAVSLALYWKGCEFHLQVKGQGNGLQGQKDLASYSIRLVKEGEKDQNVTEDCSFFIPTVVGSGS